MFWELSLGCIWCGTSWLHCWGLSGSSLSISLLCYGPLEKQIQNVCLKSWVASHPLPKRLQECVCPGRWFCPSSRQQRC